MSRAPAPFTKTGLKRAVEAVREAGVGIARVEIDTSGKIVIVAGKPTEVSATAVNELDRELASWEARHDKG
jgi:hypothetical protein